MKFMQQNARTALAAITLSPLCGRAADAGGDATSNPDFLKNIFDGATLYEDSTNPYLEKLAFTGRAQFDYAHIGGDGSRPTDASEKELHYDDFNTRRLRAGIKATLFTEFTLHVEGDFQPEEDPWYQRLTDAYIGWKYSDALNVKVGKQSMGFTLDGSTSSKELLTIDRNNLTNNLWFTNEYLPGVTVSGKSGDWVYSAGVFSQGSATKEFGRFDAGTALLASIGHDFSGLLGSKEALLTLDYVYNQPTVSTDPLFANRSLRNIASLNFRYRKDDFGFRTDLAGGQGYNGQPDVWGITVMPFCIFTDKIQGVVRYTLVSSSGDNGVRFGGYESNLLNAAKGNLYQEIYSGLNYYIYGEKLKLQAGLAYEDMKDDARDGGEFSGLSFQTGLRISW